MLFPSMVVLLYLQHINRVLEPTLVVAGLLGYVREISLCECLFTLNLDTTKCSACFNLIISIPGELWEDAIESSWLLEPCSFLSKLWFLWQIRRWYRYKRSQERLSQLDYLKSWTSEYIKRKKNPTIFLLSSITWTRLIKCSPVKIKGKCL